MKKLEELPPLFSTANTRIIRMNIHDGEIIEYVYEDRAVNGVDISSYSAHEYGFKSVLELEKEISKKKDTLLNKPDRNEE